MNKYFGLIILFSLGLYLVVCASKSTPIQEKETEITTEPTAEITTEVTAEATTESVPLLNPELTFIGRASVKIKTMDNLVIYIDPYAGSSSDYAEPADFILVTHQHSDHNQVDLVTQKATTQIFECPSDIAAGDVKSFDSLTVEAVQAYNSNHPKGSGCGFIFSFDGLTLYHSGDTSQIEEMGTFKDRSITYALLCSDDYYNMGPEEMMAVAKLIEAKYVIPIHTDKNGDYSKKNDLAVTLENAIHLEPHEIFSLIP